MARLLNSSQWMRLCFTMEKQSFLFQQQKRFLTNQDAIRILGLGHVQLTPKVLRSAYLQAALDCHPDTKDIHECKEEASQKFRLVTEAYEVLLGTKMATDSNDDDYGITDAEEAAFRRACQERLGLPAEIVEESKTCPAFRQWLDGKTDAAHYWRVFFIQHGGLAPKLRPPPVGLLESHVEPTKSSTRRRRPSQSTNL